MSSLPSIWQVLAVYHTGFTTLHKWVIQEHLRSLIPKDSEAILDWSLHAPFLAQDRLSCPRHADGKRYEQKIPALLSQRAAEPFTKLPPAQGAFYPSSTTTEHVYGHAADEYRSPLWLPDSGCVHFVMGIMS